MLVKSSYAGAEQFFGRTRLEYQVESLFENVPEDCSRSNAVSTSVRSVGHLHRRISKKRSKSAIMNSCNYDWKGKAHQHQNVFLSTTIQGFLFLVLSPLNLYAGDWISLWMENEIMIRSTVISLDSRFFEVPNLSTGRNPPKHHGKIMRVDTRQYGSEMTQGAWWMLKSQWRKAGMVFSF